MENKKLTDRKIPDFFAVNQKKVKNLETQVALYQANMNRLKKENEELRSKLAGQ